MTLRASDLPPEVRKRLGLQGASRKRTTKKAIREDGTGPYRCLAAGCGQEFPSFGGKAGWQVHARKAGHSRGEAVLT